MAPNPQPNPAPTPTNPNPVALPLEVDPGGLHNNPEVDFGHAPVGPLTPVPENPPEPSPEREQPHEPDIRPGKEEGP